MKRLFVVFLLISTLALPLPSMHGQRKRGKAAAAAPANAGRAKRRGPDHGGADARLFELYRF